MADFTFTWRGPALLAAKNAAEQDALGKLAEDIDSYLGSEFHVWTGEMRDKRFAEVGGNGAVSEVAFGSDAPHTMNHEVFGKFGRTDEPHPQIRETGDLFGRQLGPRVVAAFRARVR